MKKREYMLKYHIENEEEKVIDDTQSRLKHYIIHETNKSISAEIRPTLKPLKSVFYSYNYYQLHKFDEETQDLSDWHTNSEWFSFINGVEMEFSEFKKGRDVFDLWLSHGISEQWREILQKIDNAVAKYADLTCEVQHVKKISNESAKVLLYLVPVFSKYQPSVSIDADTGYFTATFLSMEQGMMTVLITGKGDLHYSLAERGKKLVKISGTAKIKDPRDLSKFRKVLLML